MARLTDGGGGAKRPAQCPQILQFAVLPRERPHSCGAALIHIGVQSGADYHPVVIDPGGSAVMKAWKRAEIPALSLPIAGCPEKSAGLQRIVECGSRNLA